MPKPMWEWTHDEIREYYDSNPDMTILQTHGGSTMKPMFEWTHDEIRDYYDRNPNLTILTYAGMLGLTGGELKEILNTDGEWKLEFGSAVDKEEEAMAEEMGMYCTHYNPQEDEDEFEIEARTTRNYW